MGDTLETEKQFKFRSSLSGAIALSFMSVILASCYSAHPNSLGGGNTNDPGTSSITSEQSASNLLRIEGTLNDPALSEEEGPDGSFGTVSITVHFSGVTFPMPENSGVADFEAAFNGGVQLSVVSLGVPIVRSDSSDQSSGPGGGLWRYLAEVNFSNYNFTYLIALISATPIVLDPNGASIALRTDRNYLALTVSEDGVITCGASAAVSALLSNGSVQTSATSNVNHPGTRGPKNRISGASATSMGDTSQLNCLDMASLREVNPSLGGARISDF